MLLIKAPKTRGCCSLCGRTAAIFRTPRTFEEGVHIALAKRLGTERQIRTRIADMRASLMLLEVSEREGIAHDDRIQTDSTALASIG